ncbi:hypothetical protein P3X46_028825 [Hevea brasiliensis]|uniref:PPC domain-containing protein n=1 Tax=Hevea brasiliensis TaxID=3981 RepID=A0ABQ9KQA2_HEVBR|nr:AT-hook motif nuclear-localized protein 28-like [Hevea brasiliensis]KAJ9146581.1 hypothetical protein P3X46_028825 [Hevea brasiliensis]
MAGYVYGTTNSLSRELSHASDGTSPSHSPPSVPALLSTPRTSYFSKRRSLNKPSPDNRHRFLSLVEVQKKPRGRPPGSKNKPKPPTVIAKDSESAMKPAILEISAGSDVIDSIISFARRSHTSISVISATGSVSNVTLRQPIPHAPSLYLHGPFNLLALSGSFLGSFAPKECSSGSSSLHSSCCFGISLAGAQGQVFGGIVAGKVLAASLVVVVATTFLNPTFHRLPSDNDEAMETKSSCCGPANESCVSSGMSMTVYGVANPAAINCQVSPDIMRWGPPPRPYY